MLVKIISFIGHYILYFISPNTQTPKKLGQQGTRIISARAKHCPRDLALHSFLTQSSCPTLPLQDTVREIVRNEKGQPCYFLSKECGVEAWKKGKKGKKGKKKKGKKRKWLVLASQCIDRLVQGNQRSTSPTSESVRCRSLTVQIILAHSLLLLLLQLLQLHVGDAFGIWFRKCINATWSNQHFILPPVPPGKMHSRKGDWCQIGFSLTSRK